LSQFIIEEEAEGEDEDGTVAAMSRNMTMQSFKFKKEIIKAHPFNTELAPVHETKPRPKPKPNASPKPKRDNDQFPKGSADDDFISLPKLKPTSVILKSKKAFVNVTKVNKTISLMKPKNEKPNRQVIKPEYVTQKLSQKNNDVGPTDPADKISDDDTRELNKKPKKKTKKTSGLDQEGSRRVAGNTKDGLESSDPKKSKDAKRSRSKSKKNKLEDGVEPKPKKKDRTRSKSKKMAPEDGVEL
jgi:hypothetical protein